MPRIIINSILIIYCKKGILGKIFGDEKVPARAKGRASPIKKPFSRITIILEEKVKG